MCAITLGSHGSSSRHPRPQEGQRRGYAADFPTPVTIRDNVRLQRMLPDRLRRQAPPHGYLRFHGFHGGALEWAMAAPRGYVTELVLIAGCGRHTDRAIGLGEAQRFSIMSDAKFKGGDYNPRRSAAPG